MRIDKLTTKFQEALSEGQTLALGNDHAYIEPVHVLIAMLKQEDGPQALLQRAGVNVAGMLAAAEVAMKRLPQVQGHEQVQVGRDMVSLLQASEKESIKRGDQFVAGELFLLALKLKRGQRCFHNRGTGSMGFGLPAAIGACLAGNKQRTICVEGDGGLQMNAQELATLCAQNLPVHCFVINNGGYASIRASQQNYFKRQFGADAKSGLILPNLKLLAAAYGIPYMLVENGEDLTEQLSKALSTKGPLLCEVLVLPEEPRIPRVASRQLPDGKMVSSPLEDLFPFLDRAELERNMFIPLVSK